MKKIVIVLICVSISFLSFTEKDKEATKMQEKNIVEVAAGNENFSTLVVALKAAGLVDVLSGTNQFTVFAPSNAAFNKLPKGTVDSFLMPQNKDALVDLLMYHVVVGEYKAADVVKAIKANKGKFSVNTVKGEKITFMMNGNNVVIKDAKGGKSVIIMTDIDASNGVIHAVDSVLMPKE
jgi:uncharacterized surface protein with fasciclin (FAS1) repeats